MKESNLHENRAVQDQIRRLQKQQNLLLDHIDEIQTQLHVFRKRLGEKVVDGLSHDETRSPHEDTQHRAVRTLFHQLIHARQDLQEIMSTLRTISGEKITSLPINAEG